MFHAQTVCLQVGKTNHRARTQNQQKKQGAEHRDNLKGKYVVGFSPVKIYRVFHHYIWILHLLSQKGTYLKSPIFLRATFNKNAVAAKYCKETTAVLFLQECTHVTEKLSCSQNQFTNRDTHCSLPC